MFACFAVMVVYAGWDEYLFQKHKLVAVDPLTCPRELELLNVLTKRGTYGIVNRGPILEDTGSLTSLTLESGTEGSSTRNEVQRLAPETKKGPEVLCTFKATSRVMAMVLKLFGGEASAEKGLTLKIESVTVDSIKQDELVKLVNDGRWKPDPNKSQMPTDWDGVLWVITQIKYAKKIIIGHSAKDVLSASMKPKGLESVLPDSAPDLSVEVKLEKAKDGTTVYTAPDDGRFPFGFKAIRLEYDQQGNLVAPGGISFSLGEHRPKVRADGDAWLNPDSDPDFHMRGLFSQQPERPLESLLIGEEASVTTE